jgi:hypothetical protein
VRWGLQKRQGLEGIFLELDDFGIDPLLHGKRKVTQPRVFYFLFFCVCAYNIIISVQREGEGEREGERERKSEREREIP